MGPLCITSCQACDVIYLRPDDPAIFKKIWSLIPLFRNYCDRWSRKWSHYPHILYLIPYPNALIPIVCFWCRSQTKFRDGSLIPYTMLRAWHAHAGQKTCNVCPNPIPNHIQLMSAFLKFAVIFRLFILVKDESG